MSIYREAVAANRLFLEFEKLADFEHVTKAEVAQLQALVLDVAEKVGPHHDWIQFTFRQFTKHELQHLLNIADHVYGFLPKREADGDRAIGLNAVELAFLWLSILLHDVGMFVSDADEKQHILDSHDYREYLQLNRQRQEAIAEAERAGFTVKARAIEDALFAEFIRRRHAERVHAYIAKHFSGRQDGGKFRFREIDLSRDIGNLCESHNWGVRLSRDSRRPQKCVERLEKRDLIGKTPVNVAYLACCLRLGDILDFDRSRTPLSAFHAIHFTEALSVEEWNKHLSVKGIEVTEHRAHYVAECAAPADFVAIHHFLDWVDRELQECARLVGEFPNSLSERYRLRLAPVVDRTQIRMKNPRYVAGGFRFQLDYDQIMRLLMDKSLYPDETLFLRELLQNSLDACRYQKALAEEAGMGDKYIPRIQVWDGSAVPRDPNKPLEGPRIVFQDNGVGMSLDQVENFFMRVGKSLYRSAEFLAERERLEQKGIHLDACSQFGIGFLSCFLGGNRIDIETYRHGSEPLKITIEGPRKYFLIERLSRPGDAGIPFKSPTDPARDCPPRHAGTKITVHLRDGWRTASSEKDGDLMYQTLDAVAVNQEFPIRVRNLESCKVRELAANRWECSPPLPPGWLYVRETAVALAPSIFTLSQFDHSLRGNGAIWLLTDDKGPAVRNGDLQVGSDCNGYGIKNCAFVAALREVGNRFAGCSPKVHNLLMDALERLRSNATDWYEIYVQLSGQLSGFRRTLPDAEFFLELSRGDMQFAIEVGDSLRRMRVHGEQWYQTPAEVDVLRSGDRASLLGVWKTNGITIQGTACIATNYRVALFGIALPGGFQTWSPADGHAHGYHWLPCGVSAQIDARSELAPQPAANRLFVPHDRSKAIRAAVTRAVFMHAHELWKSHPNSSDWAEWYDGFLCDQINPDMAHDLTVALRHGEVRALRDDLFCALAVDPGLNFGAFLAALHSKFGFELFTHLDPWRPQFADVRKPVQEEQIERAAARAKVGKDEIESSVRSLSEFLGWDITQGLRQLAASDPHLRSPSGAA